MVCTEFGLMEEKEPPSRWRSRYISTELLMVKESWRGFWMISTCGLL